MDFFKQGIVRLEFWDVGNYRGSIRLGEGKRMRRKVIGVCEVRGVNTVRKWHRCVIGFGSRE